MSPRRILILILTIAALALAAAPSRVGAEAYGPDTPSGTIAISARICDAIPPPADPTACVAADGIGSVVLYAPDSGYVLNMADATLHGGTSVWGEIGLVPLTT